VCGLHRAQGDEERGFLGLGLKTKWAMVCRLCHKTDGRMKMAWDMGRDLAACFTWKQVRLGFPSFASKLVKEQRWVVHMASSWRPRGSKAKTVGSMVSGAALWKSDQNTLN
jgi:hypothetical protein